MKRWRESRPAERRTLIEEALAATGSVRLAAKALQMNRQYLHEVIAKMGIRVGGGGLVGGVGATDRLADAAVVGAVGPSTVKSLSSDISAPTFKRMGSPVAVEPTERLVVEIPASIKERLEIAAAKKKRVLGLDRPSMGPLVTEALSRYLDQEEAAEEPKEGGAR